MFKINIKNQVVLGKVDIEDESVAEAISSTYSEYTHDVEIIWNDCTFVLDRRGDLSEIYDDLVLMLTKLENREKEFSVSFLSSTFTAIWNFSVRNNVILIEPKWIVVGFLNIDVDVNDHERNKLEVPVNCFLEEWNCLLRCIKNDMLFLGYRNDLENFDYLERI